MATTGETSERRRRSKGGEQSFEASPAVGGVNTQMGLPVAFKARAAEGGITSKTPCFGRFQAMGLGASS